MSKKTGETKIPAKNKEKGTRIMVFGTFDGLHPGHLNFFKQARELAENPFLIVSIARDINVRKIKGKYPEQNEKKRMALVRRSRLADKVVLSGIKDHISHIRREKPDIIALGYDQRAYVKNLKKELAEKTVKKIKIVRLLPYKENIYKNSLLRRRGRI